MVIKVRLFSYYMLIINALNIVFVVLVALAEGPLHFEPVGGLHNLPNFGLVLLLPLLPTLVSLLAHVG